MSTKTAVKSFFDFVFLLVLILGPSISVCTRNSGIGHKRTKGLNRKETVRTQNTTPAIWQMYSLALLSQGSFQGYFLGSVTTETEMTHILNRETTDASDPNPITFVVMKGERPEDNFTKHLKLEYRFLTLTFNMTDPYLALAHLYRILIDDSEFRDPIWERVVGVAVVIGSNAPAVVVYTSFKKGDEGLIRDLYRILEHTLVRFLAEETFSSISVRAFNGTKPFANVIPKYPKPHSVIVDSVASADEGAISGSVAILSGAVEVVEPSGDSVSNSSSRDQTDGQDLKGDQYINDEGSENHFDSSSNSYDQYVSAENSVTDSAEYETDSNSSDSSLLQEDPAPESVVTESKSSSISPLEDIPALRSFEKPNYVTEVESQEPDFYIIHSGPSDMATFASASDPIFRSPPRLFRQLDPIGTIKHS